MAERKKFTRESGERRRDQLMSAAMDVIAEDGLEAATVREIAARAGVTQGLIRHYFASKEELTREAYRAFMNDMTEANLQAAAADAASPEQRFVAFLEASLRPPVMSERQVAIWAAFLGGARQDPELASIHTETYLAYRDRLQDLVSQLPGHGDPITARRAAIALNGLIDGLWLEGSYPGNAFGPDELASVMIDAAGKILGQDLMKHHSPVADGQKEQEQS